MRVSPAIAAVASLSAASFATFAVAQQRPAPVAISPALRAIALRPVRLTAKPMAYPIKPIVITLDNKPEVDLRPEAKALGVYQVRSQGSRGTCSVFAMTFLIDFMSAKHFGKKNADYSEEYLNYASNMAIGQKADGGFFDALDAGYQKYGDVPEAVAPYSATFNPNLTYPVAVTAQGAALMPKLKTHFIKQWDVSTGLTPAQLLGIIFQLKQGRPVAVGMRWPKDGKFKTENIFGVTMMTAPAPADVFDGHSIAMVGYRVSDTYPGGGYFVFRNSWGNGFMDDGYGYMSFDYAKKYANDAVEYTL